MSASACSPASEPDAPVLRARRTAALTRMAVGAAGIALALTQPTLTSSPALAVIGFAFIGLTSLLQFAAPRAGWLTAEESLSGCSAILIVGLGYEHVTVLSILWLTAIASGVLARGGRQHWLGRAIVLAGLLAPIVRYEHLNGEMARCASPRSACCSPAGGSPRSSTNCSCRRAPRPKRQHPAARRRHRRANGRPRRSQPRPAPRRGRSAVRGLSAPPRSPVPAPPSRA